MQRKNIMTYYRTDNGYNDKIVARSYQISDGWIFDEGSRFDTIDPVSGLHRFFVIRHTRIEKKSELTNLIKLLEKKYKKIKVETAEYR